MEFVGHLAGSFLVVPADPLRESEGDPVGLGPLDLDLAVGIEYPESSRQGRLDHLSLFISVLIQVEIEDLVPGDVDFPGLDVIGENADGDDENQKDDLFGFHRQSCSGFGADVTSFRSLIPK